MTSIVCVALARMGNSILLGMGIGVIVGISIALMVVWVILGGIFMLIGANVAKVEGRSFGKAVLAALLAGIGGTIIGGIIGVIPLIGLFLGFFASIITQIFIIKAIFATETGKAALTWLFSLIAQMIIIIITVIIFWGAIATVLVAAH